MVRGAKKEIKPELYFSRFNFIAARGQCFILFSLIKKLEAESVNRALVRFKLRAWDRKKIKNIIEIDLGVVLLCTFGTIH